MWQERQREQAMTLGYVETMLGRRRQLPGAQDRNDRSARKGHALRAAINTPIQVSGAIRRLFAAFVVCCVLTLTLTLTCMLIDYVLKHCLVDCRAARLTSRRQPWFPSPDASSCSSWAGSCSCRHAKLPPLHTAQCRLVATIYRMVSEYLLIMCPGSDAACWPCPGAR